MPYQQKRLFADLISSVLIFSIFTLYIISLYQDGRFESADSMPLLGQSILLLIFGGMLIHIAISIIFNILLAIAENDPEPSFVVDERDRLIELKGLRTFIYTTGFGFILSMVALALGQSVFFVFIVIVASFGFGDFLSNLLMLRVYQNEASNED